MIGADADLELVFLVMGLVSATHVGVAVFENTGTELSFFDVSN
jgi:hypothetical protein